MTALDPNIDRLDRPMNPDHVKSRSGGGQSLSYIEAHQAIRNANDIFGVGNWGYTVKELVNIGTEPAVGSNGRTGFRTGYRALVEVTAEIRKNGGLALREETDSVFNPFDRYVTFSDVGFGDAVDYSGGTIAIHELACKEAVSDGVKRALKNFGDQFGLSLYSAVGRAAIAKAQKLTTAAAMKAEVFKIARDRLGKDKPSAKEIATLFSVDAADLGEKETLAQILTAEGVL